MKKKLDTGYNNLWPTTVLCSEFTVTDYAIQLAMLGEIDLTIELTVRGMVSEYISTVAGVSISDYNLKVEGSVRRTSQDTPGEMPFHQHIGSHFTAIAYLQASPDEGHLMLHDPRFSAGRGYDQNFHHLFKPIAVPAHPGDLILFPSFLYHSVTPASNFRLVIPFDIFLNK